VRGRPLFEDQVRRRSGLAPPIDVRYDELTDDTDENRLLKAAIVRLRRWPIRSAAARRALGLYSSLLDGVRATDYDPRRLPEITYSRLNEHYRPAVELARLILRFGSLELGSGRARASAFIVDMNWLFEEFVVRALREALGASERAFPRGAANRRLHLDRAGTLDLRSDISWWEGTRCVFVGDVKYKRASESGAEHADLYQLLAYTVAADLPGGMLIYAAGEGEPITHQVVHIGKELEVVALDLSAPPDQILTQLDRIASRIRLWRGRAST
jgi:5-methylcytosine-specific restriction enzyme subunit McrC